MDKRIDDAQLISELHQKTPEAIEILHKRLYTFLVSFARKFVSRDAAEDIVTEAFIKLIQYLPNFADVNKVKAWLFTTTHHACLSELRKIKKAITEPLDENRETAYANEDPTIKQQMEAEQIKARVLEAIHAEINALAPRLREVAWMILVEGLSTDEIAAIQQVKPQTVRNQKANAISLIRKALAEKGVSMEYILILLCQAGIA